MTPDEFKERFIKALSRLPSDIRIDLAEFVGFDRDILDGFDLTERDKGFLASAGLPKSAAPFLSFYAWGKEDHEYLKRKRRLKACASTSGGRTGCIVPLVMLWIC